jgi:hypothetical protein
MSVGEALDAAIAAGHVLRSWDARSSLQDRRQMTTYVHQHADGGPRRQIPDATHVRARVSEKSDRRQCVLQGQGHRQNVAIMVVKAIAEQLPHNSKGSSYPCTPRP